MPEVHCDGAISNAVVNWSAGRKQLLSTLGWNWVEYLTRKDLMEKAVFPREMSESQRPQCNRWQVIDFPITPDKRIETLLYPAPQ